MAEYIDKADLVKRLESRVKDYGGDCNSNAPIISRTYQAVLHMVENLPTADVVEVKHGYWQDKFNRNRMVSQSFCSVCGKHSGIGGIESNRHKPYCPNCGAKMNGERKCENG